MKKDSGTVPSSDSSLEKNASSHFSAGRYKNAGDIYKKLLKQSDNPDWRQKLAECYLQRALNMAAKGMPKEAAVLWENYSEWAVPPLAALEAYILWLLSVKNTQKAFARLDRIDAKQLDENHPELAVWLGFLLVSEYPDIDAHVPQDSTLMRHWQTVHDALEAYRSGRIELVDELLKKLPFRSAFRDLRSLLKAQLAMPASIEQAQTLLSKIPDHSPYRPVANALTAYMLQGAAFAGAALQLEDNQRRLIAKAKGFSNKQLELLETVHKQRNNLNDKLQFNLAIQYRELFGTELASGFCQAMLARYPGGRKDYLKNFAGKDTLESDRIQALLSEQNRNSFDAEDHWMRYIKALENQGPKNNKKIALIYRHLARQVPPDDEVDFIIDSLDYDPDDRDSYLKILNYFDQHDPNPDPEEYAKWLEKGLKQFPKDVELLVCAAKSATRKKAFKKAAKYAQDLLKIDPVNTLAKELLFSSHLAHARKLIKTEKLHLVDKELQSAERLSIDKTLLRQADLIRGFYIWATEDKSSGLKAIAEALQKLNPGPAAAHFQGFIEATLMNVPIASIAKHLPAVKEYELPEPELLHLTESIKRYDEQLEKRDLLFKALDKIKAPIKKSMKLLNYSEEALLTWSQTLEDIEHFDALKQCAKSADGVFEKPIWSYYRVVAECQGDPSRLDITWTLRLQNAIEIAHEQKDSKTEFKIRRFIERSIGFKNPFGFDDEDDFYEDESAFDSDIIEDLFNHVPKRDMIKIGKKFEEMMNQSSPEQLMMETMTKYAGKVDPNLLVKLLMDPSFLVAIMMLEAAQSLRIDIDLSFDEIIEFFLDDEPFSFPFDPY